MRRASKVLAMLAFVALAAACLPEGFAERITHQALVLPTSLAFAPDGRMFVAEKRGTIQTYDSVDDPTPELFADLRQQVQNAEDHGLLAIEVDPAWPARPYVYVQYSYDAPVGGTAPTYSDGSDDDPCAILECQSQGRVARLTAGPDHRMTDQKVLIDNVCFGYYYHGGGSVRIGPDGSLIASFGEGASPDPGGLFMRDSEDCGDPPGEGGSFRAQDVRTPADPTGLSGSIVRVDPDTGAPWPTNPLIASADVEARKIVAYGARNPYRMTLRPGTSEVWIADVGSAYAEEINRLGMDAPIENFGWPCFEGSFRHPDMDLLDRPLCESLYAQAGATPPIYSYCHNQAPAGQPCGFGGGSISAIAFYEGGTYPAKYNGALFFADYTHNDIRVMLPTNGVPDPAKVEDFATDIGAAVDLRVGPGGDLFYVDIFNGQVRRLYQGAPPPVDTQRPRAVLDAPAPTDGYTVGSPIAFAGHATDAHGDPLPASTMRWDLIQRHCPTEATCHRHFVDSQDGLDHGSFVPVDHEAPSQLEIALTVTADGHTDTATVVLTATS